MSVSLRWVSLILGAIIGYIAWPSAIYLAPLVWFVCLFVAEDFFAPFLAMLGYHLVTTDGLIHGTDVFFPHSGFVLGILFWAGSSLAFALPYLLYRPISRGLTFDYHFMDEPIPIPVFGSAIALLVTSTLSSIIPPLGLIGWTSPWLGTFYYDFIGGSYSGPIVFILVYSITGLFWALTESVEAKFAVLILVSLLSLGSWIIYQQPLPVFESTTNKLEPINTKMGKLTGLSYIMEGHNLVPKIKAMMDNYTIPILPEDIAGPWLIGTKNLWKPIIDESHMGDFAVVGAAVPVKSVEYEDSILLMGYHTLKILPDRIPVPFSMWHPWQPKGNFKMHVFGPPETFIAGGTKFGYLICYEQLLIWPELSLIGQHIQVLLAPANLWWSQGTTIPAIQHASVRAWAHFFNVPLIYAVNK